MINNGNLILLKLNKRNVVWMTSLPFNVINQLFMLQNLFVFFS